MTVTDRLLEVVEGEEERAVLFTVIEGDPLGAHALVLEGGERHGDGVPEVALSQAEQLIREHRNRILDLGETKVFAEIYGPPPRLLVYGAVDTAEAMCKAAKLLGWRTIVADARQKFATPERLPSADEIIVEWPEEAFAQVAPDHATAIVVLTHDDKFDVPALRPRSRRRRSTSARSARVATRSAAASGSSRRASTRRRSSESKARAASTSAPSRSPRRRCRSSPRCSQSAWAATAASSRSPGNAFTQRR